MQHTDTQLLISAVPKPDIRERKEMARKADIPFAERCLKAMDECKQSMPLVSQLAEDHFVRCYLYLRRVKKIHS